MTCEYAGQKVMSEKQVSSEWKTVTCKLDRLSCAHSGVPELVAKCPAKMKRERE